jgi:hypothetical protein
VSNSNCWRISAHGWSVQMIDEWWLISDDW